MRRNYMLSNADIVLSLLRLGYAHTCPRCERGMHVVHDSGLCVWCFNDQVETAREPRITHRVTKRRSARRAAPRQLAEVASAS